MTEAPAMRQSALATAHCRPPPMTTPQQPPHAEPIVFIPSILNRILFFLQLQHVDSGSGSGSVDVGPLCLSLRSSVLFIDVSGYTQLTESFVRSGRAGLERLSSSLDAYFASIIDRCRAHGGDLLKIAGDALLVAFYDERDVEAQLHQRLPHSSAQPPPPPPLQDPLPALCYRAVQCALDVQSAQPFTAEGVTLRIHAGVTGGLSDLLIVGGEPQWWPGDITHSRFASSPASPGEAETLVYHPQRNLAQPSFSPAAVHPLGTIPSTNTLATLTLPGGSKGSGESRGVLLSPSSIVTSDGARGRVGLLVQPSPLPLRRNNSAPCPPSITPTSPSGASTTGGARWEFLAVGAAFVDLRSVVADSKAGDVVISAEGAARISKVADVSIRAVPGSNNSLITRCTSIQSHSQPTALEEKEESELKEQQPHDDTSAAGSVITARAARLAEAAWSLTACLQPTSFLMPALLSRLHSGGDWLALYRHVCVLFISLPLPEQCITAPAVASLESPIWLQNFHALVGGMQRLVFKLGGQVRQLLVDDKGCSLIAVFGLPPHGQEDDSVRAVAAGLAILSMVQSEHPYAVSALGAAVTTGRAWCGALGSSRRKEYVVVGEVVNLAARILASPAAKGRVLCDEATNKACLQRIRWSTTPHLLVLKGQPADAVYYEAVGRSRQSASTVDGASSTSSPFDAAAAEAATASPLSGDRRPISVSPSLSPAASASHVSSPPSFSSPGATSPMLRASASTPPSITTVTTISSTTILVSKPPTDVADAPQAPVQRSTSAHRDAFLHLPKEPTVLGNRREAVQHLAGLALHRAPASTTAAAVVVLEAAAGLGKSWLVRQTAEVCRPEGVLVLVAAADTMEVTNSFHAVVGVVHEMIHHERCRLATLSPRASSSSSPVAASSSARRGSAPFASSTTAILQSLLSPSDRLHVGLLSELLYADPDRQLTEESDMPSMESSIRSVFLRRMLRAVFVHHFSHHPSSLVVVEDVHWLDLQSWLLVTELVQTAPSVRLLLTMRPIPLDAVVSPSDMRQTASSLSLAIQRHTRTSHLRLTGLDEEATAAVSAEVFGCHVLHPALASTIYKHSDGVPLFIQHLCSHLLKVGLAAIDPVDNTAFLSERIFDTPLPTSLEALLSSILDRLPTDAQIVVRIASVVGRHFAASAVRACLLGQELQTKLQASMDVARGQAIIAEDEEDDAEWNAAQHDGGDVETVAGMLDTSYHFTHQMLRDAAYSGLLYHQRRELHAKIADYLASQSASTNSSFGSKPRDLSLYTLAHHYWLALCDGEQLAIADRPEQRLLGCCADTLLQAASSSLAMSDLEAGTLFLTRAARCVRLLPDGERKERWDLRWLNVVLGSSVVTDVRQLVALSKETGHCEAAQAPSYLVSLQCLYKLCSRALQLMASPVAALELPALQLQEARFVAQVALWYSSWLRGRDALLQATEDVAQFAWAATGRDADYYQVEALSCQLAAYNHLKMSRRIEELCDLLDTHPLYNELLTGRARRYKFMFLGSYCLPRLFGFQVGVRRLAGKLSLLSNATVLVQAVDSTGHGPTVLHSWLSIAHSAITEGPCAIARELLEQAVAILPAERGRAASVPFSMRECALMTLRVWEQYDRVEAEAEDVESAAECESLLPAGLEADLLRLLEELRRDGDSLGLQFHHILLSFPHVLAHREGLPVTVLTAMVALVDAFAKPFSCVSFDVGIMLLKAELLARRIALGLGDRAEQGETAKQHLRAALGLVTYERQLDLRVCMATVRLQAALGEGELATAELAAALHSMPVAREPDCETYFVRKARQMLKKYA